MNMKIHKAYKFRLYPTKEQIVLIRKTFGFVIDVEIKIKFWKI